MMPHHAHLRRAQVKKLQPPQQVTLKGKMKVDMHKWWWPGKITGARPGSILIGHHKRQLS